MSSTLEKITSAGVVRTTVRLDLGDCDAAYRGAIFDVWVTPTRDHWNTIVEYDRWCTEEPHRRVKACAQIEDVEERAARNQELLDQNMAEKWQRLDAWLGETWTNIEHEDVTTIRESLQEANPAAWEWLEAHTYQAILNYRDNLRKNSRGG